MINIALKNSKKFSNNSHLGLFYAITDVYQNAKRPVNDTEMVNILKDKYDIEVERRTIKRYRDFLKENFKVNLLYYKKGYYIDNQTEKEKEVLRKENIINSTPSIEEDGDQDEYWALNIKYNNQSFLVVPIQISTIDREDYLIGIIEEEEYKVRSFKISKIEFKTPTYLRTSIDASRELDWILEGGFSFENELSTIPSIDAYEIGATLIFKEGVPLKYIKKKIKNTFNEVKYKIVSIAGVKYKGLYIHGDNLKVAAFCIKMRKRKLLVNIIGNQVKDEIRVMFGIR